MDSLPDIVLGMPPCVEAAADPYFPANDTFALQTNEIKAHILDVGAELESWQRKACRLYHEGKSQTEIVKTLKKGVATVRKCLKSTNGLLLLRLLNELDVYTEGPDESQRKAMLWRIAVDNEKVEPKEARGALAEINRMTTVQGGGTGGAVIQIVINNVLAKGALDV